MNTHRVLGIFENCILLDDVVYIVVVVVVVVWHRLLVTELAGLVCRDDSVEGLRFYYNKFLYPNIDTQS